MIPQPPLNEEDAIKKVLVIMVSAAVGVWLIGQALNLFAWLAS